MREGRSLGLHKPKFAYLEPLLWDPGFLSLLLQPVRCFSILHSKKHPKLYMLNFSREPTYNFYHLRTWHTPLTLFFLYFWLHIFGLSCNFCHIIFCSRTAHLSFHVVDWSTVFLPLNDSLAKYSTLFKVLLSEVPVTRSQPKTLYGWLWK